MQSKANMILLLMECYPKNNRDGTRFQLLRQNRVHYLSQINQKPPNVRVTKAKIVPKHVPTSF